MAVHAHPDDEAIGTGGTLARYAAEGIRTVLVTCTNGALGDMPGGAKPGDHEHDHHGVAAVRRAELEESCKILGISHLEVLGYSDSGMMGWPQNEAEDSFWKTPVDVAAKRLAALYETWRPDVVVTYDENGFYGHPDHIQAHRITHEAARLTNIPKKIYHTAIGFKMLKAWSAAMRELLPDKADEWDFDVDNPPFGVPDEQITTLLDAAAFVDAKRASIAAHVSQPDSAMFTSIPPDLFSRMFAVEPFLRAFDTTGAATPESDLFAGLR